MKYIFALVIIMASFSSIAVELKLNGITMMQPQMVFTERQINMEEMAESTKKIETALIKQAKNMELPKKSGYFILAFRKNKEVKLWMDFKGGMPASYADEFKKLIAESKGFEVSSGSIIIALNTSVNGSADELKFPFPDEWKAFMKKQDKQMSIEQIVNAMWP